MNTVTMTSRQDRLRRLIRGRGLVLLLAVVAVALCARVLTGCSSEPLNKLTPVSKQTAKTASGVSLAGGHFDRSNMVDGQGTDVATFNHANGWALYTAPAGEYSSVKVFATAMFSDLATFWVGVADYSGGRWVWHGPFKADSQYHAVPTSSGTVVIYSVHPSPFDVLEVSFN